MGIFRWLLDEHTENGDSVDKSKINERKQAFESISEDNNSLTLEMERHQFQVDSLLNELKVKSR